VFLTLKLKCDFLVSNFAFKCNLYRYCEVRRSGELKAVLTVVGLYRMTPPDPQLKGAWFQPLRL
jgi:hypothetical protein